MSSITSKELERKLKDRLDVVLSTRASEDSVKALVDDTIKGILRSIGDAGAAPKNYTGCTLLYNTYYTYLYTLRLHEFFLDPKDAETFAIYPLAANATKTGPSRDFIDSRLGSFNILGISDVASATDGVKIEQSINGTNWDYASTWTASAGVGLAAYARVVARYARAVWVNGATAQTYFRFGGRYSIPASDAPPMSNPHKQNPPPEMYYPKTVKVKDEITGEERSEVHYFLRCASCGREIDTNEEGFYGSAQVENLVLCEKCYLDRTYGSMEEWDKLSEEEKKTKAEGISKEWWR